MEKKICSQCGKEFETSTFNSFLDKEDPVCDPCKVINNNKEQERKRITKQNKIKHG